VVNGVPERYVVGDKPYTTPHIISSTESDWVHLHSGESLTGWTAVGDGGTVLEIEFITGETIIKGGGVGTLKWIRSKRLLRVCPSVISRKI
jgi:hypothetical protein